MKATNATMETMLDSLSKHLDRRDVIGYAAARNTRILQDELKEFQDFRNDLVLKHGEDDPDGGGKIIASDSPNFADFMEEYLPLCGIEHNPEIFTIPYEEAIGILSGTELLEIDWMFGESE